MFVGEVSVYEKETQIIAVAFIIMIVACSVATNQGWLLFTLQSLIKQVNMVFE